MLADVVSSDYIHAVRVVGIRELKARLSHYVRMVGAGETILVTDRGEVVAEMRAPGVTPLESSLPPGVLELARRGMATLPLEPEAYDYPRLPPVVPEGTAARWLDEERGPR